MTCRRREGQWPLAFADTGKQGGLEHVLQFNVREFGARLCREIACPHVADVPQGSQPLGGIEGDLRHFPKGYGAVVLGRILVLDQLGSQFGFVDPCAQAFLKQATHPVRISRGQRIDALVEIHQLVGIKRHIFVHHEIHSSTGFDARSLA